MYSILLVVALAVAFIAVGELLSRLFPSNNIYAWPNNQMPGPDFYGISYPSQEPVVEPPVIAPVPMRGGIHSEM